MRAEMFWDNETSYSDQPSAGRFDQLLKSLDIRSSRLIDPQTLFSEFTHRLQDFYEIRKGFLAVREGRNTRFLAIASFNRGRTRRNLSLRLPPTSSLFDRVIEDGRIYTENFATLFDGNTIERQLLVDDSTSSFVLRPLKHDGQVVGLLGYSSDNPNAFVTFEEGLLDPIIDRFAGLLAHMLSCPGAP